MRLFIGTVKVSKKITVIPKPIAAFTLLEIAKKVHIPKK